MWAFKSQFLQGLPLVSPSVPEKGDTSALERNGLQPWGEEASLRVHIWGVGPWAQCQGQGQHRGVLLLLCSLAPRKAAPAHSHRVDSEQGKEKAALRCVCNPTWGQSDLHPGQSGSQTVPGPRTRAQAPPGARRCGETAPGTCPSALKLPWAPRLTQNTPHCASKAPPGLASRPLWPRLLSPLSFSPHPSPCAPSCRLPCSNLRTFLHASYFWDTLCHRAEGGAYSCRSRLQHHPHGGASLDACAK